jgi:hypothetical protein
MCHCRGGRFHWRHDSIGSSTSPVKPCLDRERRCEDRLCELLTPIHNLVRIRLGNSVAFHAMFDRDAISEDRRRRRAGTDSRRRFGFRGPLPTTIAFSCEPCFCEVTTASSRSCVSRLPSGLSPMRQGWPPRCRKQSFVLRNCARQRSGGAKTLTPRSVCLPQDHCPGNRFVGYARSGWARRGSVRKSGRPCSARNASRSGTELGGSCQRRSACDSR